MKREAPAAARNFQPIAQVLAEELPSQGVALEVASGTGEHITGFARLFPHIEWQPSDRDPAALASISAWRNELVTAGVAGNLREPVRLDVCEDTWPGGMFDAILAINMVHISPPEAARALFANARPRLANDAPLILYGPFFEQDVVAAPSNVAFDDSLKARNRAWGLRQVDWIDELARNEGLGRTRRTAMPANNLILVYRRPG